MAELPELVYYRAPDGIVVNLYTPSKAEVALDGGPAVSIEQETRYPSAGDVRIRVNPAERAAFTLRLRIPRWCATATVRLNDEAERDVKPGAFHAIERTWQTGDEVHVRMPMALRLVKGRKAQAGRVAIMHGPLVFCFNRAKNEALADEDQRLLTIDPDTIEGPFPDDTVHPDGLACKVKAWRTTSWYPHGRHEFNLYLTEFPDPRGEATYWHVPNPNDKRFVEDELAGVG